MATSPHRRPGELDDEPRSPDPDRGDDDEDDGGETDEQRAARRRGAWINVGLGILALALIAGLAILGWPYLTGQPPLIAGNGDKWVTRPISDKEIDLAPFADRLQKEVDPYGALVYPRKDGGVDVRAPGREFKEVEERLREEARRIRAETPGKVDGLDKTVKDHGRLLTALASDSTAHGKAIGTLEASMSKVFSEDWCPPGCKKLHGHRYPPVAAATPPAAVERPKPAKTKAPDKRPRFAQQKRVPKAPKKLAKKPHICSTLECKLTGHGRTADPTKPFGPVTVVSNTD